MFIIWHQFSSFYHASYSFYCLIYKPIHLNCYKDCMFKFKDRKKFKPSFFKYKFKILKKRLILSFLMRVQTKGFSNTQLYRLLVYTFCHIFTQKYFIIKSQSYGHDRYLFSSPTSKTGVGGGGWKYLLMRFVSHNLHCLFPRLCISMVQ